MKTSIILTQAQNVELYGLDLRVDMTWLGCTLTSDNGGISNPGHVTDPNLLAL